MSECAFYDNRGVVLHQVTHTHTLMAVQVCGSAPCGSGTAAACLTSSAGQAVSAGQYTQRPVFEDGAVSLTYTSGAACTSAAGSPPRTSVITFTCDPLVVEGSQQLRYLGETDQCESSFTLGTRLMCGESAPIACLARGWTGITYDLSPLARYAGEENWSARTATNVTYLLNVCRPLAPFKDMGVCNGAAVCQRNGTRLTNLGAVQLDPVYNTRNAVTLVYLGETGCSVSIMFTCKTGTYGTPVLDMQLGSCIFAFTWATSLVCDAPDWLRGDKCKVTDTASGVTYDFSSLMVSTCVCVCV